MSEIRGSVATVRGSGAWRHATRRITVYGLVGLGATCIHYLVLAALVACGVPAWIATALGALVGAAVHYAISARVVFGHRPAVRSAASFGLVAGVGMALNASVVWLGHEQGGAPLPPVQLLATGIAFVVTYALNATWSFAVHAAQEDPGAGSGGALPPRRGPRLGSGDEGGARLWTRAALVTCGVLLALRLVSLPLYPLTDRTESRYAEIAREMVVTDDWVTPHVQGMPFWAKPPLSTWCEAGGIALLGRNEFAVRFPAWLATLLTIAAVWQIGAVLGGDRLARGGLVVFATAPLTLAMAGGVMTDPFLGLGTAASLWGILLAVRRTRERDPARRAQAGPVLLTAGGLAVATLAKGPIGLLFGGLPVMGLLLSADGRRAFRGLPWVRVVLLYGAIAVPWFLLAEQRTPGFLEYFLVGEHFQRFVDPNWAGDLYGGTHPKPTGIIWLYLVLGLLPWVPVGIAVLRYEGVRGLWRSVRTSPSWAVVGVAMLLPLALFTFAGSLLPTYVYPAIAPASLLLAAGVMRHRDRSVLVETSPTRVPAWLCAIGVPVILVTALLPENAWVASTQRDVLQPVAKPIVVYTRSIDTLYSASFYSDGRAVSATRVDAAVWSEVRAHPEDTAIVTKKGDVRSVPDDLRPRLRLVRDIDRYYQVWSVGPGG